MWRFITVVEEERALLPRLLFCSQLRITRILGETGAKRQLILLSEVAFSKESENVARSLSLISHTP